jgi:hypothetical protein
MLVVIGSTCNHAQTSSIQPPAAAQPERIIGKAEVYYFENKNQTKASVYLYILGQVADIYQKKDVLTLEVGYEIAGKKAVEPKDVYLILTSYSGEGLKYKENHKLTIYIDDKLLLSEDTIELFSRYYPQKISSESFKLPKIKYTEFLKWIEGKKVTLQFGEAKIDLNTEVITALQDLKKTIEK